MHQYLGSKGLCLWCLGGPSNTLFCHSVGGSFAGLSSPEASCLLPGLQISVWHLWKPSGCASPRPGCCDFGSLRCKTGKPSNLPLRPSNLQTAGSRSPMILCLSSNDRGHILHREGMFNIFFILYIRMDAPKTNSFCLAWEKTTFKKTKWAHWIRYEVTSRCLFLLFNQLHDLWWGRSCMENGGYRHWFLFYLCMILPVPN